MAIGFPARYGTQIQTSLSQTKLVDLVAAALQGLDWAYSLRDGVFYVHFSISWWSWGEEIFIDCAPNGVLFLESRSSLPQVFDWGRNRRNVERLLRELRLDG